MRDRSRSLVALLRHRAEESPERGYTWLAQGEEMLNDKEQKIARPRQMYVGYGERPYKSLITR